MKRIYGYLLAGLVLLGALNAAPRAEAQFPASTYKAADYGAWVIQSQQPNSYQFSPVSQCTFPLQGGGQFNPLATNAPVYIQDATPANSEVATPSSLITTGGNCGVVITTSNQHFSFLFRSGTAGLQESLNTLAVKNTAYPATILLDRNWWTQAGAIPGTTAAAILTAATGNTHAFLQDITTAGSTYYVWNGTAYVSGTWVNTKPTAAAGAGAGTAPTIADAGTALSGTVALTAGTATTTGTLFTLTWATSAQFLAAPGGCTVTSNGATVYSTFTSAVSFSSSHAVLTVTVATTPPTASTAYSFTYSCF